MLHAEVRRAPAMIREAASEAAEGLDQPLDVLASLRGADVEHVRPLDPISSRDPSRLVWGTGRNRLLTPFGTTETRSGEMPTKRTRSPRACSLTVMMRSTLARVAGTNHRCNIALAQAFARGSRKAIASWIVRIRPNAPAHDPSVKGLTPTGS